jgi:glycosyltransferase involved in cell wall biosynthesis
MNILQVSSTDLIGQRFNGQYISQYFNKQGHQSTHLVWTKEGDDPNTHEMIPIPGVRTFEKVMARVEDHLSIRGVLHPSSFLLSREKAFKASDVVHYHLLQWPNYFSTLALPSLTQQKPSVWTIHDFYAMTGRCVYPFDCERWKTGCGKCPYLKTAFKMKRDHTALMWKIKNWSYKRSQLSLIAASEFMKKRIEQSPLLNRFPIYHVPFGVDLNEFKPGDSSYYKRILGIDEDEVVIAFRAAPGEFKGFDYITKALAAITPRKKVCLLTFNVPGLMEELRYKYKIVDLGWVNDSELTKAAYQATDFFLMPSTQEAFGMMAMEAMAFGKPVVVFEGTSLPEVVGGSEIGIVIKQSVAELAQAIHHLIDSPSDLKERGVKSREFAVKNYDLQLHLDRLLKVYQKTIEIKKPEGP